MTAQRVLDDSSLPEYLAGIGLFEPFERIRIEKAGDGNINWVRRASTADPGRPAASYVIKQARPTLERFPEYAAPTERLLMEERWYRRVAEFDHTRVCPGVHGFQEADRVLVLEDLGSAERLDRALARGADVRDAVEALAAFLGRVHAGTHPREAALAAEFANEAMQRLHGDHIFVLPLRSNEFPLPERTAALARELWSDAPLRAAADRAYARYLDPHGALVHGDVQAGNILLADAGPKLLDAEIAHVGDPAFDIGTLLAHLALPTVASGDADAASALLEAAWTAYAAAHGPTALANPADAVRYAGLEMLRRTIGAARVEAVEDDAAGVRVAEAAVRWILDPSAHAAMVSSSAGASRTSPER